MSSKVNLTHWSSTSNWHIWEHITGINSVSWDSICIFASWLYVPFIMSCVFLYNSSLINLGYFKLFFTNIYFYYFLTRSFLVVNYHSVSSWKFTLQCLSFYSACEYGSNVSNVSKFFLLFKIILLSSMSRVSPVLPVSFVSSNDYFILWLLVPSHLSSFCYYLYTGLLDILELSIYCFYNYVFIN